MTQGQYASILTGMTTLFLAIKNPEGWAASTAVATIFLIAVLIPKLICDRRI